MIIDYKELAIKVGYSYLNGDNGYWEDDAGKLHSYDSMDNKYLDNCIKFVNKGIKELKNNGDVITKDIKKHLQKQKEDINDEDVVHAKLGIIEILKDKKSELKEYKEKRKNYR